MKVELLQATPDAEKFIQRAAKCCYSKKDIEDITLQNTDQYIEVLFESHHESPMEHVVFTFGVEGVSRALLAQITRHRLASFSVQSQRYCELGNATHCFDYVVPHTIQALGDEAVIEYNAQMAAINTWYHMWIEKLGGGESAREDARFVLPNACATKFVVTMNARELLHFFSMRCCKRAQWEIRELALAMLELVKPICPTLFAKAGAGCVRGKCPEGKRSCGEPYKRYE